MVKITVDLIEQCAQYTNAVKEREIDLRGYKISLIENMGATLVSYSVVVVSCRSSERFDYILDAFFCNNLSRQEHTNGTDTAIN